MTQGKKTPVPLLDVQDMSIEFRTRSGVVKAVDSVSFSLNKGEMLGIVGESGSGKSVSAYAIMGILDAAGKVTKGSISLAGLDVLNASARTMREVRGREASMIFQSPRTALNPIRKTGKQLADVLREHGPVTRADLRDKAIEVLSMVRIPDPAERYHAYPFELSGGMCQRVMIAMALACTPQLLIADEPTTGLDVTTQAAIMDLIADLARARGMATVLITHDLALAAEYCDRIAVMHAGQIVETAPTKTLFRKPKHPYTQKLMMATPFGGQQLQDLKSIPGSIPDLRGDLPACRFAARCEAYKPKCDAPLPNRKIGKNHHVFCWGVR